MTDLQKSPWSGWETVRLIGRGSFGTVYELRRELVDGTTESAAMKVITIPQNQADISEMYGEGYDDESITATFRAHLKNIVAEYSLMRKLDGSANAVNCKDISYIQHSDGIGWDIFIRMELLTPLTKTLSGTVPEETVLKIGRDICSALVLCKKYDIVHRDIKPQNIFVSPNGDYKLGDFGIAKTVEKTMGGTKVGTYKYMAPEVYNNRPYGSGADLYSLGLVLYWLLNDRRMPFMPLPPAKILAGQDEEARQRRLSGEPLPPPAHGSAELKAIVLKACAYAPEERFHSAREMYEALCRCSRIPVPQEQAPAPAQPAPGDAQAPVAASPDAQISDEPTQYDTVGAFGNIPVKSEAVCSSKPAQATAPAEGRKAKNSASNKNDFRKWLWLPACLLLLCGAFGIKQVMDAGLASKYRAAQELLEAKDYSGAAEAFAALGNYADSASKVQEVHQMQQQMEADYQAAQALMDDGKYMQAMWAFKVLDYLDSQEKMQEARNCFIASQRTSLSAGYSHTVALRSDGIVVAAGTNADDRCNVGRWTNIVEVSAGGRHTVGLLRNGTVAATGANSNGQCNSHAFQGVYYGSVIGSYLDSNFPWADIVAVSAGEYHTVGLRSDGTVVATGANSSGQCDTSDWADIVAVSAGKNHTVGLRSDGTVVATGANDDGQCRTDSWTNIVAVSAGAYHTAGLRSDGTVVVTGLNDRRQCRTDTWTNIVAVSAGEYHTAGLRSDGTVVTTGWNANNQCETDNWTDIIAVSAGGNHTVGLCSDGTVVATGANYCDQCDVDGWANIATKH